MLSTGINKLIFTKTCENCGLIETHFLVTMSEVIQFNFISKESHVGTYCALTIAIIIIPVMMLQV